MSQISAGDSEDPILVQVLCGTKRYKGRRCGRSLGTWMVEDDVSVPGGQVFQTARDTGKLADGNRPPKANRIRVAEDFDTWPEVWPPGRFNRYVADCPACPNIVPITASFMARRATEARARGETFVYLPA